MTLLLDGHTFGYEMSNLCFLFFPGEKVNTLQRGEEPAQNGEKEDLVVARLKRSRTRTGAFVTICRGGARRRAVRYVSNGGDHYAKDCELALGRAFYDAASRLCGFYPPWGILTGIRPAKLVREKMDAGLTPEQVRRYFTEECLAQPEKAELCMETALAEERITRLSTPDSVSLYIAIPFCPTRCLYCSFISHDVEKASKLLPRYVELLCDEIAAAGQTAARLGLRLETVYMGGGTPTTLSAGQLKAIFDAVRASFNLETLREYTVEAGRPDTITAEKLEAIRAGGATRVCINPQTLDDAILRRIGRSHTSEQVLEAFALARAANIPSVNMDLIAGLPGDTPEGFRRTLAGVEKLKPEGITVHALAMKRASRLVTSGLAEYDAHGVAASRMVTEARQKLAQAGYAPYYLYRQRNSAGNLENVGYALPGYEGLYNVYIMDETHTILSVGAGGVTKMKAPYGSRIERVFNFKYPYEYIARFDEILSRKKQVLEFYDANDWKNENPAG